MQLLRFIQVCVSISCATLSFQAVAQAARDTESEVSRYLRSSGMAQIVLSSHSMLVLQAVTRGQLSKARADCYISRGAANYVADVLAPLVRKHFTKTEDLAAINDFNESEVGRRIVTHIEIAQKAAVDRFSKGESPDPLPPLQFTDSELAAITRFQTSPAYASYRDFEGVLKSLRGTSEYKAWLTAARAECSKVQ